MRLLLFLLLIQSTFLSAQTSYLEDKNNSLTSKNIVENARFLPLNKDNLNIGITNSTYWLKLSIDNNSSQEQDKVISFKAPLMDEINLYELKNEKLVKSATVGHIIKQDKAMAVEPKLSFHINLSAHTQNTFYMKIESQTIINLSFSIYSPEEFSNYTTLWYASMALYIGATIMILIYNSVLYFLIRIRSYLYYVLFHTLFLLFILDTNGYLVQFVYPDNPTWERITIPLFLSLALLAQVIFAYEFLSIKKYGNKSKKVLKVLIVITLMITLVHFVLPFREGLQLLNLVALFINIVPLVIAIIFWIKLKNKGAKYYTIAWIIFISGNMLETLKVQGVIELSFSILNPMQIGALIEMIVISVALADRFNTIRNKNKELVSIVHTDFLTKIKNRNYFFERANSLLATLKRKEEEHSLIMLDIDYFKSINDTHGHAVGDKVLVAFSGEISKLLREEDVFARIGGEEFVLLIRSDKEESLHLASRIREMVESLSISHNQHEIKFTVSLGIYSFNSAKLTADEILSRADSALYKAKENGRNCIECAL